MTFDPESESETTFGDFRLSGNAAVDPHLYDIDDRAIDPDGLVLAAVATLVPWAGKVLVTWAAAPATGPSPTQPSRPGWSVSNQTWLWEPLQPAGSRGSKSGPAPPSTSPDPDANVDVIHARFVYFFPPRCDAGLADALQCYAPAERW